MMSPSLKQMVTVTDRRVLTDLHSSASLPFALHWGFGAGEGGGTSAGRDLLAAPLAATELASPWTLRGTSGFFL